MPPTDDETLSGEIFELHTSLSIYDLSRMCTVDAHYIVELVDEGIVNAAVDDAGELRFAGDALRRVRTARRLQRDLEINLAGVALALQLMEELDRLRRELRQGAVRR